MMPVRIDACAGSEKVVRPAGLEPAAYGLGTRRSDTAKASAAASCSQGSERGASRGAFFRVSEPNLALLVDAWPKLSEAVKSGILAMVKSVISTSDGTEAGGGAKEA